MTDGDVRRAARRTGEVALDCGLVDQRWFDDWLGRRGLSSVAGEATPLAVRGYLGLLYAREAANLVPHRGPYIPTTFGESERRRVANMGNLEVIDNYRFALSARERFNVQCRETAYLENLGRAWRIERDSDLVDVGRMCDVLSLFSWFLALYRDLDPDDLGAWPAANQKCLARNAWLAERDGGAATKAALDVINAEKNDPDLFRIE